MIFSHQHFLFFAHLLTLLYIPLCIYSLLSIYTHTHTPFIWIIPVFEWTPSPRKRAMGWKTRWELLNSQSNWVDWCLFLQKKHYYFDVCSALQSTDAILMMYTVCLLISLPLSIQQLYLQYPLHVFCLIFLFTISVIYYCF